MALHPDFLRSPYAILPPESRWFPAAVHGTMRLQHPELGGSLRPWRWNRCSVECFLQTLSSCLRQQEESECQVFPMLL